MIQHQVFFRSEATDMMPWEAVLTRCIYYVR